MSNEPTGRRHLQRNLRDPHLLPDQHSSRSTSSGPTAFNLLGIDRWVRNFQYVVYYDSWDGAHPRVFAPKNRPYVEFESSEQINNYLLRDPEVQAAPADDAAAPR